MESKGARLCKRVEGEGGFDLFSIFFLSARGVKKGVSDGVGRKKFILSHSLLSRSIFSAQGD